MNKPNTFLIGVQKAATTSVYNWLSQHPEVCAPLAMKDISFFTRPMFYKKKGINYLLKHYQNCSNKEIISLQGSVHYIFFEDAICRIKKFNPHSKFILILRQPMERAISSYLYAVKFGYENLSFEDALKEESKRMETNDLRIKSECTYINHGFYAHQIKVFLKYFKKEQLKIVFYEDIKDDAEECMKSLYKFLSIEKDFKPDFKTHNKTGTLKSKFIQRLFLGNHRLKNVLVKKILPKFISEEQKANLRWKIIHLNTSNKKKSLKIDSNTIEKYNKLFQDDINELEKITNRDLSSWKKTPNIT